MTNQTKDPGLSIPVREGESVLVALDAAHCNRGTAEFIGGKPGWDYLITVKTDKPTLYGKVKEVFSALLGGSPGNVMTGHSHGVIKTWSCWTFPAREVNFPHIAQVACVCREVRSITGEKLTKDVAVLVTSRNAERMSAADLNKHACGHWGIETRNIVFAAPYTGRAAIRAGKKMARRRLRHSETSRPACSR